MSKKRKYSAHRKRLSWPLLAGIAALHIGGLYLLALALAPDFTASIAPKVIAAFNVASPPSPPPPPTNRSEPDEGAQGSPGEKAVAAPVSAPPVTPVVPEPVSRPQTAATGAAARAGARDDGEGTGAAGNGLGTGSGNQGAGMGGVAVSKPEHIAGSINNVRDYPTPEGGREMRRGTQVVVRVIVGVDGRARQCSVYRPSPDPEADRITCDLVESRLRFRPAQDAAGNPVPAAFYWRQRWF